MGFKLNPLTGNLELSSSGGGSSIVGEKYVRTTRFEIINAGTSGSVTLPANSEVVLNDFGGDVDAGISKVSSAKPTFQPATTITGNTIATSFDSDGNWVLTGTPSSYPIAIIYRVRQELQNFDSTSSNIIGNSSIEDMHSIKYSVGPGQQYTTIQSALNAIGNSTQTSDCYVPATVFIEGGVYDEDLTIPKGKIISLIAQGPVVLGNGAGANWSSTNTRSITVDFSTADMYAATNRPALNLGVMNSSDSTSTFIAQSASWMISGDLNITGTNVSATLNLHGVKIFGDLVKTSVGLLNIQAYRSYIVGTVDGDAVTYLNRCHDCQFDGLVTIGAYNSLFGCEINGGMTVSSTIDTLPPSGMFFTSFNGTFTGPASSLKLDASSEYYFVANGASLAGGATKVLLTSIGNTEIKAGAGIDATKLADGSVTNTELQYINTLSSNAQTQLDAKAKSVDIQLFTSSGTWTKPAGAKSVKIYLLGAGGGAGSGRKGAAGTVRCGGGGGAGGGLVIVEADAAILGSSETVTIGAGGTGGPAQTANSTDGNDGVNGGDTTFGTRYKAPGGTSGKKGTATNGVGGTVVLGAVSPWNFLSIGGILASTTGGVGGTPSASSFLSPAGGASGGGITSADVASNGAIGGNLVSAIVPDISLVGGAAGGAAPANAGNGSSADLFSGFQVGSGGGSSRGSILTNCGAGGNGGRGAGGGGGGAALDGVGNSGAGGNGGDGACLVITYF